MAVSRKKTVTEVVVFTLENVPEEYASCTNGAVTTIVNGEVDEVKIHIGNYTCAKDTDCIEWLTALAGLANGLLEELEKDFPNSL